mmetsp:Transcript_99229/g.303411  ORF Transcript_99229/g.303411 Transcript_99229/m.303411 type:complete len:235 (-) Transcript_99229:187-891(-)
MLGLVSALRRAQRPGRLFARHQDLDEPLLRRARDLDGVRAESQHPRLGLRVLVRHRKDTDPGHKSVEVAPVGLVRNVHEHRQEHERGKRLPDIHDPRRDDGQRERHPHVGEHRKERRDVQDRQLLHHANLVLGDDQDAHRHDHQQVEGRGTHDGGGPEPPEVEVLFDDVDHGQENLRGGGPESHQREGGDGFVPDLEGPQLAVDLPPASPARDHIDAGHEQVSHDCHADKPINH